MRNSARIGLIAAFAFVLAARAVSAEESPWQIDFSGDSDIQDRQFFSDHDSQQHDNYLSVAINPRWRFERSSDDIALTLRLFARHDFSDDSRTHADIREAMFQKVIDNQDWRAGIGEVFWGVVESRHLVDIINQQDFLERFDGDAKLGQPLLNWNLHGTNNTFELYILPAFREREFPGPGGRLRGPLPIAEASYESRAGDKHVDAAMRWQLAGAGQDLALSYFHGTAREPLYQPAISAGHLMIRPEYLQLSQWGLDAQKSVGNLLLKMEAIYRDTDVETSWASVTGLEYTLENIGGGDLGLVLEYLRDTRDAVPAETFEDDIFAGLRFSTNALSSTYFLAGIFQDRSHSGRIFKIEANTRIAENVKLTLEAWRFDHLSDNELIGFFNKDDFLELGVQYFFD